MYTENVIVEMTKSVYKKIVSFFYCKWWYLGKSLFLVFVITKQGDQGKVTPDAWTTQWDPENLGILRRYLIILLIFGVIIKQIILPIARKSAL